MSSEHTGGPAHEHLKLVPEAVEQPLEQRRHLELVGEQSEEALVELERLRILRNKIYELAASKAEVRFKFGEDRYVGQFGKVPIFLDDEGNERVSILLRHGEGCHDNAHRTETLAKASLFFSEGVG